MAWNPVLVEGRLAKLLENLKSDSVKTIVLEGVAGVGKTWMARTIRDLLESSGLFDIILWLFLNREHDVLALYKNIARQLSILAIIEERRDDGYREEMVEGDNWSLEKLKQKISEVLANKRCLLILDDEGNKMNEEDIMPKLEALLPRKKRVPFKVLITTKSNSRHIPDSAKTIILVESLTEEVSMQLLYERAGISESEFWRFGSQFKAIINKTMGLPSAIVMIAELLRYLREHDAGNWTFETALEEVAYNEKYGQNNILQSLCMLPRTITTDCLWNSRQLFRDQGSVHYNALIAYWILEGYLGDVDNIEKTYENGHSALMELVNSDMLTEQEDNFVAMEGALLKVDFWHEHEFAATTSLELANVFEGDMWKCLERIICTDGMIKSLGNDNKCWTLLLDWNRLSREVPDSLFSKLQGLQVLGLFNPRFKSIPSSLSKLQKLHGLVLRGCCLLENIDGIQELKRLTVLEISGASSLKTIPNNLFENMPDLQSLNLSHNQIRSLPESIFTRSQLRRLILRKCYLVGVLPTLRYLEHLEVLDVSGATSLERFIDKSLTANSRLLSIDLSHTNIKQPPLLPGLRKLNRLLLRCCPYLSRMCIMANSNSLQIFDASSSINLREIPEETLNSESLITLNLSETRVTQFPSKKSDPCNLYLRGCSKIQKLPSTADFKKIELIDLSGAIALREIVDESFEHLRFLRYLNLSQTRVKSLPALSNLGSLCHLLLKDCLSLEALPEMDGLERLEVLDLSGASSLKELKHLNYRNLRRLLLKGCSKLVELPQLNSLKKLEVLDLSGCKALEHMKNLSFEQMAQLWMVDLSETGIESLPPLPRPSSLCRLILRDCNKLKRLPPRESLRKVEELDLGGASALEQIEAQFLQDAIHLRILNLSRNSKLRVLSMFGLHNLTMLSLPGCSKLEKIPQLEKLEKLEILDLSGTIMRHLPSLTYFSNLRKLMLRGCSYIKRLINLESLRHLEVLDLFGTGIEEFPYEISKLTCLQRLDLPDMNGIQLDWGKIKFLPKELNLEECSFPKLTETVIENEKPFITVTGTKLFQIFKSSPSLFKQFHFSVCSPDQSEKGDNLCHRDEFMYPDIYAQTRKFPFPKEDGRCLEIRGFVDFPIGIEDVFRCAEYLSLVENNFISCLYDLGVENIKALWIERCNGVENILTGEENVHAEEENVLTGEENAFSEKENALTSEENVHAEEENVLTGKEKAISEEENTLTGKENALTGKENVLTGEEKAISEEENTLTGKENVLTGKENVLTGKENVLTEEENALTGEESAISEEENVLTSEEKAISEEENALTGKENVLTGEEKAISEEENALTGEENVPTGEKNVLTEEKMRGRWGDCLEILCISNMANLKSLCSRKLLPEEFKNLKELYLECCPKLVDIFSSSQVPENLEILQIKFCDRVESVFGDNIAAEYTVRNLHTLDLFELPELKTIGGVLPFVQILKVKECPNLMELETDIELDGRVQSEAFKNLKELYLESCPKLVKVFSYSYQAENLEILLIKFCIDLKTVFEIDDNASAKRNLPSLHNLFFSFSVYFGSKKLRFVKFARTSST